MPGDPRFDPSLMALRGRIGGHATASRHDSKQLTSTARAVFRESFDKVVDPDGLLAPEERARRAAHARSEHFSRLAYLSAAARRGRASSRAGQ